MNEQVARNVVLVRAIETMDTKNEVLSEDDRMYASRSARELAQWQAAEKKSAVTSEHFLQQRSEQILKRLAERTPAMSSFLSRKSSLGPLSLAVPLVALLLGAGLDRISDPHRVDLLSPPLLGIIGWNLLVYVILLIWLFVPSRRTGWSRWVTHGRASLPRKLPHALAAGMGEFTAQWTELSAPLNRARMARAMHLAAAAFALGATLSLYARGIVTEYRTGWESTFLDAGQVHALLSALFAPAVALLPVQPFSLAEIEALRFSSGQAAGGARWVHLYAATLLLLVVLPRLVLSAASHWKARRLALNFPLDLEQPYFRKLGGQVGASGPAFMRVLPYSFTVDEARGRGLLEVASMLLGEQARVMVRPSSPYGEEAIESLKEVRLDDPDIAINAVLFNLAATPEKENHGAFLDHLVRSCKRGVAALVDESSLAERSDPERIAERIALWQQFCQYHKVPATFVNLLNPAQRPIEQLPVSKVP